MQAEVKEAQRHQNWTQVGSGNFRASFRLSVRSLGQGGARDDLAAGIATDTATKTITTSRARTKATAQAKPGAAS